MINQVLSSYQSVIVLNGSMQGKSLLPYVANSNCIIAADGAAAQLDQWGIEPHYIIGDGDSFTLSKWKGRYFSFRDQNSTDFEKSIKFAKEVGKTPSLVIGMNGGEMDHVLGNVHIMMRPSNKGSLFFLDAQLTPEKKILTKIGIPLINETFRGKIKKGSILSILPFPLVRCTSRGLHWELDDHLFEISTALSLRNRVKLEEVEIQAVGQGLLIVDLFQL